MTGNNKNEPEISPTAQWTQHDIDLLHDMVRDYDRARWFRGQLKWWAVWIIGLPTAGVSIWKAIEELIRLFRKAI